MHVLSNLLGLGLLYSTTQGHEFSFKHYFEGTWSVLHSCVDLKNEETNGVSYTYAIKQVENNLEGQVLFMRHILSRALFTYTGNISSKDESVELTETFLVVTFESDNVGTHALRALTTLQSTNPCMS